MINNGGTDRKIRLEWSALLSPSGDGQVMLPTQIEAVTVLQGQTGDLYPVMFITGGAKGISSPYTSLVHDLDLLPTSFRRFTWVQATRPDPEEAFRQARFTATRNWEAEIAKVEMINSSQIEIQTGNSDWDAAFALGQKVAHTLVYSPSNHLTHKSFVSTRQPDQGFSPRGDGTDYSHLWNGQTALEAWYLSGLLLPSTPEVAKGLLLNFFRGQSSNGRIDWKPGLAGQRSQMLAMPVLASLAWRIYQYTEDKDFLDITFQPLLEFVHAWFQNRQDRDGDGIPEWDNPIQTGFDDNPSFSRWHIWSQAADITLTESPDLCAYLYRECQLLIKIAHVLGREEAIAPLEAFSENLRTAVEASYQARRATYQYWDRETHLSRKGEILKERTGPGELLLDIVFELPNRLLLRMESNEELPTQAEVTVHGTLPDGKHRVERIGRDQILWVHGLGTATLQQLYADLEHVQIEGLPKDGKASIEIVDHCKEDHTLLTPLWAEIPEAERAKKIINRKLNKATQYRRRYGIPACPKPPKYPDALICENVWLPWNVMVGEGLLAYGAWGEAVDLVTRLMNGIVENLKREHAFRKHYHADHPQSLGERNALLGLPPISLFINILGVRIISPWKVKLNGFNPYPWPVKLKYRGLIVECNIEETVVTFPDGQSVTVDSPQPCVVSNVII
jgi:hypothetical protein